MDVPWVWFRKLALALFGLALLTGLGTTALFMGHRLPLETWRILFVLALVVLIVTSAILIPGVLLPNLRSPHPEFLSDDLEDEWEDLRGRQFSRPHMLLAGGVVAVGVYVWSLFFYGKVTNAIWFGWFPVGVVAVGLSLLLFAFARLTSWYADRAYRTPTWVILIVFAGFGLAQYLGVTMTEQVVARPGAQSLSLPGTPSDYTFVGTRGYYLLRQFAPDGGVPDLTMPDCDDDACAYLFLAILAVVLVLILVLSAAVIPHMWVVSCLVLLTFIVLLILHEIHRDRRYD